MSSLEGDALRVVELAWSRANDELMEGLAFNLLPRLRAAAARPAADDLSDAAKRGINCMSAWPFRLESRPYSDVPVPAPQAMPAAAADAKREREIHQLINERDTRQRFIDNLLDALLGEDREEWSSAYGFSDAAEDALTKINALAQPVQQPVAVLSGWSIKRSGDWIAYRRPDGWTQSVTPHEQEYAHSQTLFMLLDAMLSATPQPLVSQSVQQESATGRGNGHIDLQTPSGTKP